MVEREGRAIVFAATKWDLIENKAGGISKLREQRDYLLPQVAGAPFVAVSTVTGEGLDRLTDAISEADRAWNTRIPTAELNRFLEQALHRHAPPASRGRRIRLRYMTQPKARPPTFALFGNQLKALPELVPALSEERASRDLQSRRCPHPADAAHGEESVRG